MRRTVDYFMNPLSPWTFLGHDELRRLCDLHGVQIRIRPMDLGAKVFPVSGGLPLPKRAPQRQAYRLHELRRWAARRGVPLNIHPKYFPTAGETAARLIIAADQLKGVDAAMDLAGALMRATWCEERDVGDEGTLRDIIHAVHLDPVALFAALPATHQAWEAYTQEAIDRGVFGAPWYVYQDEPFWGQDRLDFLADALAAS